MATVVLQDQVVSVGAQTVCHVLIDYDDVALNVGVTVTGTGNPVANKLSAGGKAIGKEQPLAPFFGLGRQVLLRNVVSTDVLPLDADGVPTKMTVQLSWTP